MHGITQASIETPRTTLMTIAASLPCWLSLRPAPYPALPSLMPPAEQREHGQLDVQQEYREGFLRHEQRNLEAEYGILRQRAEKAGMVIILIA
jgi:hypothetical protein